MHDDVKLEIPFQRNELFFRKSCEIPYKIKNILVKAKRFENYFFWN